MFMSPTLLLLCGLGGGYAAPQLGPTQQPPPPDPANTAPKAEGDYSDGCYYVESQQRWICGPANPTTQPPTTTTNPSCDTPEGKYLCRVSRKLLRGPGQKCYWDKYEEIWKCGPASPPDNPDPDGCMDNPYLCRKKRLTLGLTGNVDGRKCYYNEDEERWECGPGVPPPILPGLIPGPGRKCYYNEDEERWICEPGVPPPILPGLVPGPGQKCYWDKYEEIWKCGPASPPDIPDPDGCMDNPYLCRLKRLRQDHTRNVDGLRSNSWALLGKTLEEAEEIVNDKGIIHLGWKSSHLTVVENNGKVDPISSLIPSPEVKPSVIYVAVYNQRIVRII